MLFLLLHFYKRGWVRDLKQLVRMIVNRILCTWNYKHALGPCVCKYVCVHKLNKSLFNVRYTRYVSSMPNRVLRRNEISFKKLRGISFIPFTLLSIKTNIYKIFFAIWKKLRPYKAPRLENFLNQIWLWDKIPNIANFIYEYKKREKDLEISFYHRLSKLFLSS